jgi:hypothetical protein
LLAHCEWTPYGDYVHRSLNSASGHGWWNSNCSSIYADAGYICMSSTRTTHGDGKRARGGTTGGRETTRGPGDREEGM